MTLEQGTWLVAPVEEEGVVGKIGSVGRRKRIDNICVMEINAGCHVVIMW